jgi:hypothetical protein
MSLLAIGFTSEDIQIENRPAYGLLTPIAQKRLAAFIHLQDVAVPEAANHHGIRA